MKKKWLILTGVLLLFSLTFANKSVGMCRAASFDVKTETVKTETVKTENVKTENVKTDKPIKVEKK